MPLSGLTDEIEFKVFRSHVKIPMIFLVPIAFLVTLYAGLYFYANSSAFRVQLPQLLHQQLGGRFELGALKVDSNMTRVHLFDAALATPEGEPVIDAQELRAELNPLVLLVGRISVAKAWVRGAHVRTIFDDEGRLELLVALGVIRDSDEEPEADDSERKLALEFADIEVVDSAYTFHFDGLDIHIPQIDIPKATIAIEPDTLLMRVDHLDLERVDLRFSHELLHMPEAAGDWEFSATGAEIRNWRWANDGFGVESIGFWVEGVHFLGHGQMNFPSGPDAPTMTYDGRAHATVAHWSPLAQYFIRDAVHFTVPSFEVAARGTLDHIDGVASVYASHVETAGLRFHEVRGDLSLKNEWIELSDVSGELHGGTVDVPSAYVNIFEVIYGAHGTFQGVNPRSLLQDFEVDLEFLDGEGSGGFEVHGGVPFFPERPNWRDPYMMRDFGARRLAEVRATEDWVLKRANREIAPARRAVLKKGATTWVDFDRVVVPSARLLLDDDAVTVDDFRFAYPTMTFEKGPDKRPIRFQAELQNVDKWAALYGLEGLSGPARLKLDLDGPLASPEVMLEMKNGSEPLQLADLAVPAEDFKVRLGLKAGRLTIHDAALSTLLGSAEARGWVDLLEASPPTPLPREPGDPVFAIRRHQPADLSLEADGVDLEMLNELMDLGALAGVGRIPLGGALGMRADLKGSLQDPDLKLNARVQRGEIFGQAVPEVALVGGVRRSDELGRAIFVDELNIDAAGAGRFLGDGYWALDGAYEFSLRGDEIDFEQITPTELLAEEFRPAGAIELALHGKGTLDEPDLGGHIHLREGAVGERDLGDIFLTLNTEDEVLYLAGAALPLSTLQVQLPLGADEPYYVRLGMEQLDLSQAVAELRGSQALADSSATGMVELFIQPDFSSWRMRTFLSELEFKTLGRTIKNRGPLVFELVDGETLRIENMTIGAADRYVSAEGSVSLEPLALDVALDGQLDLSILNPLRAALPEHFPQVVVSSSGALDLDARFKGGLEALEADGHIGFENAQFMLRGLDEPVEINEGRVRLAGSRIEVPRDTPLSGSALGGVYSLVGALELGRGQPPSLSAEAWSHNMKLRAPGTASVTFDTNLTLDAPDLQRAETWLVGGDVDVLDGIFYRDTSVIQSQLTGRVFGAFDRRTERYEATIFEQIPMLSKLRFNVALRARDGFKVESEIERLGLNLELRVDLRLRDTLVEPFVSGDVDVISGVVGFQGERFTVRSGTVRFSGELGRPWIDVTAGADIRNRCREDQFAEDFQSDLTLSGDFEATRERYYHVMLHLNGYADNLDVQFESNPYADQRDILSLLLTGCTVDQLTASSASGPTLEIALGPLLGRIEKEIQDVVKVNEFTIMPGVERTQVRIGDQLSRRLSWNFQLDTGMNQAAGGQRYQLEYRLSDRWGVELSERSHTESNNFLLDLKLKYSLPLK